MILSIPDPNSPTTWYFLGVLLILCFAFFVYTRYELYAGRLALASGRLSDAKGHFRRLAGWSVAKYRTAMFDAAVDGLRETYKQAGISVDVSGLRALQARAQKIQRRNAFYGEGPRADEWEAVDIFRDLRTETLRIIDFMPPLEAPAHRMHTIEAAPSQPIAPIPEPDVVTCICAQRFRAPAHLFGQHVACPACSNSLYVPDPRSPHGCNVACRCGAHFHANRDLCGTQINCPSCAHTLKIPFR